MIVSWLAQLPRRTKRVALVLTDCIVLPLSLWFALALRLGEWPLDSLRYWLAFSACLVSVPVFAGLGLYQQITRYISNQIFFTVAIGAASGALAVAAISFILPVEGFPRSVPAIFWLVAVICVSGGRFTFCKWLSFGEATSIPIIVYGAGREAVQLIRSLAQEGRYNPVACIDDDKGLHRRTIDNLAVYPPQALATLIRDTGARQIWVVLHTHAPARRREILSFLEPYALRVRLISDPGDVQFEHGRVSGVRDVRIADLLGREEVKPVPYLLKNSVAGRQVMVTGAGGSIGSELCRCIVLQGPKQLVLLDHSEYNLYRVEQELARICSEKCLDVAIIGVLGSVTNRALVRHNLVKHGVETLYHAAAYKHVSLVENNVVEGFRNNTFGTLYTAEEAMRAAVEDFILISTDKAVRTSSVMGATKRLAEMVLQALQREAAGTRFSVVRFGNVLNSSGSVVPRFLEQIERGGPITVTHREVTRYFMTTREAAELVMQAASMAQGGEVFLLDMGKSMKIVDLATQMARLKGYSIKSESNPDGDIEIQFTGLGRGEKLHEDLLVGEDVAGTQHSNILRTEDHFLPWQELRQVLDRLEQACSNYDHELIHSFAADLLNGCELESFIRQLSPAAPVTHLQAVTDGPERLRRTDSRL